MTNAIPSETLALLAFAAILAAVGHFVLLAAQRWLRGVIAGFEPRGKSRWPRLVRIAGNGELILAVALAAASIFALCAAPTHLGIKYVALSDTFGFSVSQACLLPLACSLALAADWGKPSPFGAQAYGGFALLVVAASHHFMQSACFAAMGLTALAVVAAAFLRGKAVPLAPFSAAVALVTWNGAGLVIYGSLPVQPQGASLAVCLLLAWMACEVRLCRRLHAAFSRCRVASFAWRMANSKGEAESSDLAERALACYESGIERDELLALLYVEASRDDIDALYSKVLPLICREKEWQDAAFLAASDVIILMGDGRLPQGCPSKIDAYRGMLQLFGDDYSEAEMLVWENYLIEALVFDGSSASPSLAGDGGDPPCRDDGETSDPDGLDAASCLDNIDRS